MACWQCMAMYTVPSYTCTPVPGLLNTHSTALLSPPSVTATSRDHPKVYKLNYQLVISRKKAHPSRDSWDPRREWRSLMSTSLSVVPIQLNLVRNSESRSALSIFALALPIQHTRLRRGIIEFSHDIRSLLLEKRVKTSKSHDNTVSSHELPWQHNLFTRENCICKFNPSSSMSHLGLLGGSTEFCLRFCIQENVAICGTGGHQIGLRDGAWGIDYVTWQTSAHNCRIY